eukprot:145040-Karenia_brevis.AAC.1
MEKRRIAIAALDAITARKLRKHEYVGEQIYKGNGRKMEIGTIDPVDLLIGVPGQIALFQDTLMMEKGVYDPKQRIPVKYGDTLDL